MTMFDIYAVEICITAPNKLIGGLPKGDLFDKWVAAKQIPPDIADENKAELDLVEEVEGGITCFRRDEIGLFIRDFMVKACLKESAQRLGFTKAHKGLKGHLQTGLYVKPRNIHFRNGAGENLQIPTGFEEAQGRVYTPAGYKSILRKAEYVTGAALAFEIHMLPFYGYGEDALQTTLALCQEIGLGSMRSREEGKFELVSFKCTEKAPHKKAEPIEAA